MNPITEKMIKENDPQVIQTLINSVLALETKVAALERRVMPAAIPIVVDYVPNPFPMDDEELIWAQQYMPEESDEEKEIDTT